MIGIRLPFPRGCVPLGGGWSYKPFLVLGCWLSIPSEEKPSPVAFFRFYTTPSEATHIRDHIGTGELRQRPVQAQILTKANHLLQWYKSMARSQRGLFAYPTVHHTERVDATQNVPLIANHPVLSCHST